MQMYYLSIRELCLHYICLYCSTYFKIDCLLFGILKRKSALLFCRSNDRVECFSGAKVEFFF